MPIENNFIVCPNDCDTPLAVAVENVDPSCPPAPTLAEIDTLLLMHPTLGVPPTDWAVAGAGGWADVIDNSDLTDVKIKQLSVIGTIAAPERPEIIMPAQTKIQGVGTYSARFEVRSLSDGIYDYLQKLQCGGVKPNIWYTSLGGYMYGQNDGIETTSITVNFIKESGEEAYDYAEILIEWRSKTDPLRIDNPLA